MFYLWPPTEICSASKTLQLYSFATVIAVALVGPDSEIKLYGLTEMC